MGIIPDLYLEPRGARKYLPSAPHILPSVEKMKFSKLLY